MRIIATGTPLTGHINPIISLASILSDAGHKVLGFGPDALSRHFSIARIEYIASSLLRDYIDIKSALPEYVRMQPGPSLFRFYYDKIFVKSMIMQFKLIQDILEIYPADLILCDNMFLGILPMLLTQDNGRRPIIACCGAMPLPTTRDDGAPFGPGLPPASCDDDRRRYTIISKAVEEQIYAPVKRDINDILVKFNCNKLTGSLLDTLVRLPDLYLQPSVPDFEYPNSNIPESVFFIGSLPVPTNNISVPAWGNDLDGDKRVIFVTQGTLANDNLNRLIVPTIEALADREDLILVISTGGLEVDFLGFERRNNIRISKYLPLDWILPKASVVITNGGFGTVNLALSYGVPLIVAGDTEDKAEVANRVAHFGVGINLRNGAPSVLDLRNAVSSILDKNEWYSKAKLLQHSFARYDARKLVPKLLSGHLD